MRCYAVCGDVYVFAGRPTIRFMAECLTCAQKPPYKGGPREFVSAAARDEWAQMHAEHYAQHDVACTVEVLG